MNIISLDHDQVGCERIYADCDCEFASIDMRLRLQPYSIPIHDMADIIGIGLLYGCYTL